MPKIEKVLLTPLSGAQAGKTGEVTGIRFVREMPGMPDGVYYAVMFRTSILVPGQDPRGEMRFFYANDTGNYEIATESGLKLKVVEPPGENNGADHQTHESA